MAPQPECTQAETTQAGPSEAELQQAARGSQGRPKSLAAVKGKARARGKGPSKAAEAEPEAEQGECYLHTLLLLLLVGVDWVAAAYVASMQMGIACHSNANSPCILDHVDVCRLHTGTCCLRNLHEISLHSGRRHEATCSLLRYLLQQPVESHSTHSHTMSSLAHAVCTDIVPSSAVMTLYSWLEEGMTQVQVSTHDMAGKKFILKP